MSHRFRKEESVRRPEIDLALARANAASAATAAEQTTFVIDPLATVGRNVYNTLAQALAAAASVAGPKVFEFRGAAVNVPAGVYDFGPDPVRIIGQEGGPTGTTVVTFANGATIAPNANIDFDQVAIESNSVLPLITVVGNVILNYRFFGASFALANAAGSIIRAGAGSTVQIVLGGDGAAAQTGVGPAFEAVGAGATVIVLVDGNSHVFSNTIAQSATGAALVVSTSAAAAVSLTQTGIPGGLVAGTNYILQGSTSNLNGPGGASPSLQAGTIQLATGTTALIPATITANSRISVTVRTMTPGAGNLTVQYAALTADRVVGLSGAGGGFKITALIAAGTINTNDTSFVDWQVVN